MDCVDVSGPVVVMSNAVLAIAILLVWCVIIYAIIHVLRWVISDQRDKRAFRSYLWERDEWYRRHADDAGRRGR